MKATALLGAVVLAATTAIVAQQPPRTGALAPGGTGLIAGRVTDPASRRAVPDAIVWLLIDDALRPESPRVMTDTDGRFVFVNVPAGRYGLQAQKTGHLPGRYGAKSIMDAGRDLDLGDGQILTDVALPIWPRAAIGGTVTDEAGEPVVGVSVRVFRKLVAFGEIRYTPNFQGTTGVTDDRGAYRIASLAPGEFIVAVPSTVATFPAALMSGLDLPGFVQNEVFRAISEFTPLGSPANQQVGELVMMSTSRAPIPPVSGDEVAAVYRTTVVPAATKLGDATSFVLGPGEERSGVDITLRPVRAARVSGRIIAPEGAPGPTAIRLIPSGEGLLSTSPGFEAATGVSDAAGRFTLLGVPEGEYFAWVEKRMPVPAGQAPGSTPLLHGIESVTVSPAGAPDVVVTLQRAPRVTVRFDTREASAVNFQNVEILVEPVGVGGRATLVPDATGTAAVQLVPGRYVVTPYATGTACTSVLNRGRDVSDELLVLERDDVELTVVCGEPPTRLSGTVRNERGSPDGDAIAVVFPADRRFWTGAGLRARRKTSAFTSASGSFSMVNLPPGDYLVAALMVGNSDFWQDPQVLDKLTPIATRVSLLAGETRTVDVRTVKIR